MAAKSKLFSVNFTVRKELDLVIKAAKLERRSVSSFIVGAAVVAAQKVVAAHEGSETSTAAD